jgi:1-aminocyclopropane-1-carboxylate deaminase
MRKKWDDFIPGPVQFLPGWGHDQLSLLRLDLIQSWADGNKYYKLKYNLKDALQKDITTLVSKGGMFSNHLYSLAHACSAFELKLICIVRAHETDAGNPLMNEIQKLSHDILFLKPDAYKDFDEHDALALFPDSLFIPEGGMNAFAMEGVRELMNECQQRKPNHIIIAGGTMTTACGLIAAADNLMNIHIVPAWKGCTVSYVQDVLSKYEIVPACQWEIWPDFHFGGFAKFNQTLVDFMSSFTTKTGIPLDPVYTGKMLYGVMEKIKAGYFPAGDGIMVIHSGGLQGLRGFSYRYPEVWGKYELAISDVERKIGS